jgi:hypothetical protein
MSDFQPTVLLVKTHNVTGKKYFCKTTMLKRVNWYTGSGVHWKRHLKVHGNNVTTGVLGFYLDKQRCVDAAIKFSKDNNIVESDEWLNHVVEDGLTGFQCGEANCAYGKENRWKGKKRTDLKVRLIGSLNGMYGKPGAMLGIPKPKGKDSPLYGRKRPEGGGKKPNAVIKIDENGIEKYYPSVADASRDVGVTRSMINRCCSGKQKTSAGFKWRYAND